MSELKDIDGYEGRYAVTDDGRVWSYVSCKWLSSPLNDWGYPRLNLRTNNHSTQFTVHRLVAMAFCKKNEGCNEVNHIDGDKTNNRSDNLEWVTSSQNSQHAWDTGLQRNNLGIYAAQKARRRFSSQAVIAIRQMSEAGFTRRVISALYDCSEGSVQKIVSFQSYKEISS